MTFKFEFVGCSFTPFEFYNGDIEDLIKTKEEKTQWNKAKTSAEEVEYEEYKD